MCNARDARGKERTPEFRGLDEKEEKRSKRKAGRFGTRNFLRKPDGGQPSREKSGGKGEVLQLLGNSSQRVTSMKRIEGKKPGFYEMQRLSMCANRFTH